MIRERSTFVESALKYAEVGWKVYPIQPPNGKGCSCRKGEACPDIGKHPHFDLGGIASACRDKRKLKTIFGSSEASIGLLCEDSFWVLDVDGEAGLKDVELLIQQNEELPKTPVAATGSGGRHYYFAFDRRVKRNITKIGGCSIDIRTKGGAVVAPPSRHSTGKSYEWIVSPDEADLSDAPEWLIDFVTQSAKGSETEFCVAMDNDLRTAEGAGEGERNSRLCQLVGTYLAKYGDAPDILKLAIGWGSRCDPPMESAAVSKTVANLIAKHLTNNPQQEDDEDEAEDLESDLVVCRFSDIEAKAIDWLWEGRFALGKITLLTGEGGVGKSMLTCDMASRISKGISFPDGAVCPVGDSFFIAGEDGAEDTIRPRLDAAEANVDRVHLIRGPIPKGEKYASPIDLSRHIDKLDQLLLKYPEAKMLVIDPIMDYLGVATNSDRATDVRRVLSPLRELAERHKVAIVAMNHLNKRQGGSSKSRSLGSGAFVQVARIELRVCEDPEDADRRLLLPVKNNLGAAAGLAYRIQSGPNKAGFAVWEEGTVDISINDVESDDRNDDQTALAEAVDWLGSFLSEGEVHSGEAIRQAGREGIAKRTLDRAKKKLRVDTYQRDRKHWWKLPDQAGNNPQDSEVISIDDTDSTFVF